MVREISAGAVVFRRIEGVPVFLLLHYSGGHWDFVKGHIEKNETEEETVIRETAEETGLKDVKILKGFRERVRYFFRRVKSVVYKEVIFYVAETKESKVKISREHVGYVWMPYDEAMMQLTFENARSVLKKANEFISKF